MLKAFLTVCLLLTAPALPAAAAAAGIEWDVQLTGVSHHFDKPSRPGFEWNQKHDGVGIQRTIDRNDSLGGGWITRQSLGAMVDSFGRQGAYAGVGLFWRDRGRWATVDYGVVSMLLYRAVELDVGRREATMRLIPAVLPSVGWKHLYSGFGLNLVAVPRARLGEQMQSPGVLYLQATLALK